MSDGSVFGRYLVMAGALRFVIEFVRVNLRIAGPFTLAQIISATVVAAGLVLLLRAHHRAPTMVSRRRR